MKEQMQTNKNNKIVCQLIDWGFTWKGLINNEKGEWFLFFQLIIIFAHLLPAWIKLIDLPLSFKVIATLIFSFGVYRSINSLTTLGESLSPLPEPKSNSVLKTNGIYKTIRHPLYQSLIIISLSITMFKTSLVQLILFFTLIIILIQKAKREERKLKIIFKDYHKYMADTPAIFPHIKYFDWRK